jgi:hypothetical protein
LAGQILVPKGINLPPFSQFCLLPTYYYVTVAKPTSSSVSIFTSVTTLSLTAFLGQEFHYFAFVLKHENIKIMISFMTPFNLAPAFSRHLLLLSSGYFCIE